MAATPKNGHPAVFRRPRTNAANGPPTNCNREVTAGSAAGHAGLPAPAVAIIGAGPRLTSTETDGFPEEHHGRCE